MADGGAAEACIRRLQAYRGRVHTDKSHSRMYAAVCMHTAAYRYRVPFTGRPVPAYRCRVPAYDIRRVEGAAYGGMLVRADEDVTSRAEHLGHEHVAFSAATESNHSLHLAMLQLHKSHSRLSAAPQPAAAAALKSLIRT